MDYKAKLQEILTASGLSQQSLAKEIGISFVSMNSWLNGKSVPTRKTLLAKIDALYVKYTTGASEESGTKNKDITEHRIKYYGLQDLATSFYLKSVVETLDSFDESKDDYDINDILEIYNILLYVENMALPSTLPEERIKEYVKLKPKLHKVIATFFNAITEENVLEILKGVGFDYHDDLLTLLGRHKRYADIDADLMLEALVSSKVAIWSLLANRELVDAYDQSIRRLILSSTENAEQIVHKYLDKSERREVHLPVSLSNEDKHTLLESYIQDKDANPNYLQLMASARVTPQAGIDAKIKLLAKRKHDEWTDQFFNDNKNGQLAFSCKVIISETQDEAIDISNDGQETTFAYSKKWLDEHSDNLSILGNFIHLFPLVNKHMLLTLPSYTAQLGVVERYMKVAGRDEYPEGVHFQFIDMSTFLQTRMYEEFLHSHSKRLEEVIAWFFADYLQSTFAAEGFNYTASSKNATYLEKCNRLFSEMDSIIKQFKLHAENGDIEQDLLAITSESPKYKDIPSHVPGKYIYTADSEEILAVLHYLFSDQSGLTYVSDDLKGKDFADLLTNNEVKYSDFHDYQKRTLDKLIALRVLKKSSKRLTFQSNRQIVILRNIFQTEAISYYHYSDEGRAEIDEMVSRGWLVRKSSLLTVAEAKYFSYFLNQQDSSNGHDLRNSYLHGSMSSTQKADEKKHYQTYIIALRMFIALILKIDDDFSMAIRALAIKEERENS